MKLIVCVLLLFALPHHSRAIDVPQCSWTDIEARDTAGDTCGWYNDNSKYCGAFDDDDFKSKEMCCGCKTSAAAPEIFSDDDFADYFAGNQGPGNQAKVSGGVIYLPNHLSGGAERVIETLLQETLETHDVRFTQGVDAYWTLQIWLARKNRRSNFHSYAKNLPTGIQTIKMRLPTAWMGTTVLTWSKVAEKRVIVY